MVIKIVVAALIVISFCQIICGKHIKKKKLKNPPVYYKLVYQDAKKGGRGYSGKVLKSERYGISGKPDYIFESPSGILLPVELKSGRIGSGTVPRPGDFMQLIAYFLIIEESFGKRPRYGRLAYADCMFIIKNTRNFRKSLIRTINRMRLFADGKIGLQPECSFTSCRYCICRGVVCEFNTTL